MTPEEAKTVVAIDPWKACDLAAESVEKGNDDWRLMVKHGLIDKITANIDVIQDSSFLRQTLFGVINSSGSHREACKQTMVMFHFIGVRVDDKAKVDLLSSASSERAVESVRWFEQRGLVSCEEWLTKKDSLGVNPQNVAAIQAMAALNAISAIEGIAPSRTMP